MNTQNFKGTASESSKTWVNGKKHKPVATSSLGVKVCVNAASLSMRWVTLESGNKKAIPLAGAHLPARNGSYGVDLVLLDEAEVNALIDAGVTALERKASSPRGMTALYDAGETSAKRYIIVSRGQIFYRTGTWSLASKKYLRRASEVLREEVRKFLDTFDAAIDAGLDLYQASDVARGLITLEKALNPEQDENQETASSDNAEFNEIPF